MNSPEDVAQSILDGDIRSAARLIRRADEDRKWAYRTLNSLHPHTGRANFLGVTGLPGVGKSTLISGLITAIRADDETVGCLTIDPTSRATGGAVLGDRVRMQDHSTDEGVFIHSMATRGALGGLSYTTPVAMEVLDAMGFDWVIVETVGVGQDEIDIAKFADTNAVVVVPGLGDTIQTMKAGLNEIADIFVVNKSELEGSLETKHQLQSALRMDREIHDIPEEAWIPPVVETVALEQKGLDTLWEVIGDHTDWRVEHAESDKRRRQRVAQSVHLLLKGLLMSRADDYFETDDWEQIRRQLDRGQITLWDAMTKIVDTL